MAEPSQTGCSARTMDRTSWHRDWIDVCERLIGTRTGTGGHAGSVYLRRTLDKRFFSELREARSILQAE